MDCSGCDNVQSIVDPQAILAVPADSNDGFLSAMYKSSQPEWGFMMCLMMATVHLVLLYPGWDKDQREFLWYISGVA